MSNFESGMEMGATAPTSAPASISNPNSWAIAQLQFMGLPVTTDNINFLVSWAAAEGGNWNNTAHFNPLNTTLQMPGSTPMNSVGVQAFTSWDQGLQATADTLHGYPQITAALQSGNAMAANDSGQLASDFSRWSGGGYTHIGNNTGYGGTTGGPMGGGASVGGGNIGSAGNPAGGAANGQPLSMADIGAVDAWIRQNWGSEAWFLSIPEVKTILEQGAVNVATGATSEAAVLFQIQQTEWWKTTSAAVKQFEQDSVANPADYNFTIPGSKASQALAQVQAVAGQHGVNINPQEAQTVALNSLRYGWDAAQTQAAIGANVTSQQSAPAVFKQLQAAAGQYLMNVSNPTLQSWAQNIAAGTQTIDQFNAYLAQNASVKWSGMAPMIQQGLTPNQIVDNYRQTAAQLLEVSPDSIDFVNNPSFAKILDYVPPGQSGSNPQDAQHRMMTQSEMSSYIKGTPGFGWQYTQNAKDAVAPVADQILQTYGFK